MNWLHPLIVFFVLAFSLPAQGADYPEKCNSGYIIKRDVFFSSGTSSPLRRNDPRYEETKVEVRIRNGEYDWIYKQCWSNGVCSWVGGQSWRPLGRSSHSAGNTRFGYNFYSGTMPGSKSFYVCWFR